MLSTWYQNCSDVVYFSHSLCQVIISITYLLLMKRRFKQGWSTIPPISSRCQFRVVLSATIFPFVLQVVHVLFKLFILIYMYWWCQTRFPYQMMFNSKTTGISCGAKTADPSGAHDFTPPPPPFLVGFVLLNLYFSVYCFLQIIVCLLDPFLFPIVLSILLRFTASDYPFGIFKHFSCFKEKWIASSVGVEKLRTLISRSIFGEKYNCTR